MVILEAETCALASKLLCFIEFLFSMFVFLSLEVI